MSNLSAEGINKSLRRLAYATVGVYLALVGVVGFAWYSSKASTEQQICEAIEVIKDINSDNLRDDIASSKQFLVDHPGPNPIPGIPRLLFVQGIEKNEARLLTLAAIKC